MFFALYPVPRPVCYVLCAICLVPFALCPVLYALCPLPCASCPATCVLCPIPLSNRHSVQGMGHRALTKADRSERESESFVVLGFD
jgi:hypothetical protein